MLTSLARAALAIALSIALPGCLRNEYDLCDRLDPHPECDAGRDASGPDGSADAGVQEAGTSEDSAVDIDAATSDDAGETDIDAGTGEG